MPATSMVKYRLRKGRVSWILPVVHVIMNQEGGVRERLEDAMLEDALLWAWKP